MQGMTAVDTYKQPCAHSEGSPNPPEALYLCYVCAAPWNMGYYLERVGETALFDDIGSALLGVGIYESRECGCEGRLILHSLQDVEPF